VTLYVRCVSFSFGAAISIIVARKQSGMYIIGNRESGFKKH